MTSVSAVSMRCGPIVLLSAAFAARGATGDRLIFADVLDDGEKCAVAPDVWPCLKGAGSRAAGAVLKYQGDIPLFGPYLTLVHQSDRTPRTEAPNGDAPRPSSVYSKLLDFVDSRALRVLLPVTSVIRLLVGPDGDPMSSAEGRGKKNKGNGAGVMAMGGMMLITTLLSAAFGALALLASKALMTSILALMLSAMAVVKKSGGHHAHARTTYEVINGLPSGYHQATNFKLEGGAVIPDVSY